MRILGMQDNPPVFSDGKAAEVPNDVRNELPTMPMQAVVATQPQPERLEIERPKTQIISVTSNHAQPNYQSPVKAGWPPILWVIGGPGSNKATLCSQASKETGWTHISLGKLLRAAAEPPDPRLHGDTVKIRDSISAGEMVPLDIVMKYVESHMAANIQAPGIILDGFPRDMTQVAEFESKFKQKPTIILLDCSKLQLGRGRLDDSVTAFRRRLEIFRQLSLPMLKAMDNIGRLTIVDGDTDTTPVQEDFKSVVKEHIQYIKDNSNELPHMPNGIQNSNPIENGHVPNGHLPSEATLHDLEAEPIETISNHVQQIGNGVVHNGVNHIGNGISHIANGKGPVKAPVIGNGYANNIPAYTAIDVAQKDNMMNMYSEVNYMDSHI